MKVETVWLLWTSGWDSTFRLLQLLQSGRQVQPVYVLDPARRSSRIELETQRRIREEVASKETGFAERLLPTLVYPLASVREDEAITDRWHTLASRSFLGTQYDWLARLADQNDLFLELSVHRDDTAHGFLEGELVRDASGDLVVRDGVEESLRLFDRFMFPLFDVTKTEMEAEARENGVGNIMEMTWFCAVPLLSGEACGYCNPCRYTRDEGMGRRVPDRTIIRFGQYLALKVYARLRSAVLGLRSSFR